jgi:hypothetical protein
MEGKNRGRPASPVQSSIGESSGIPKQKNFRGGGQIELRPLFTGQLFIVAEGLLREDSPSAPESAGQACHAANGLHLISAAWCRRFLTVDS